ncbi:MAG: DEAD/DEAH box helicase [Bacteroidetes bacterium]|nr:DEAD/DEAH box helicase [Bacteroidota bacterium]
MSLDPLKTTEIIKESFTRYLTSSFHIRDHKLRQLFYEEVEKFGYMNGPILEATPPFKSECTLKNLAEEGLISAVAQQILMSCFPYLEGKLLYTHQEKSIRKVINNRNILISSGTGSGKTECFLIPILNHLINEHKAGQLGHGVRALLLYPMNALANDQLRRLRDISAIMEKDFPDVQITFGRYVGDTKQTKKEAIENFRFTNPGKEPVKNELLSREEMQKTPPHIIITNYAMLEYLMLRPDDSPLFDGEYANKWKFLVLDEAHIYNGAQGVEMGMLLRRLKDRVCEGQTGKLQCIATGATLVKEDEDFDKVAEFANNLFGETFEKQDIIKGEKISIPSPEAMIDFPKEIYLALDKIIQETDEQKLDAEFFIQILKENNIPKSLITDAKTKSDKSAKKFLYEILLKDRRISLLRNLLKESSQKLEDILQKEKLSDIDRESLISLINIAVWSRPDKDSLPLLPARYHVFVRAPEGVFVSFYSEPKIFLERREVTDDCHAVFELATCRRCGQEYLVGNIVDGKLRHPFSEIDTPRKNKYFLITEDTKIEDDEDEGVAVAEEISELDKVWKLCTKCGLMEEEEIPKCDCPKEPNSVRTLIEINFKTDTLNKCHSCGLRSINIVREFVFQQDAPTSVLATALFQNLDVKKQGQKKILVFSDSRQDAAFFAPYLELTYKRILWRRVIVEALKQNESIKDYRLESLCGDVLNIALAKNLFDQGMDDKQKKKETWGWIIHEFCALDKRNCLEGTGLLSFSIIPPNEWMPINELLEPPLNLTIEEAKALYKMLLDTFRYNKAITFPKEGPTPQDEIFKRFNRNKEYRFRGEISDNRNQIYSFLPTVKRNNSRLEFLKKLNKKITGEEIDNAKCRKLLGKIWNDIQSYWKDSSIELISDRRHGILYQLNYQFWRVNITKMDPNLFSCDKCGVILSHNVRRACPTFGCDGDVNLIDSYKKEIIERNHYRYLYENLSITNLKAEEHTAQLKQDEATQVQNNFISGKINVLSCTTTFELGVDLGELETIFLRNIPPEPANYIQRSGRAGRRLDSVGFTLTFAQLRSHDLTYFKEPQKMVEGKIKPPVVQIKNEKIVRRHLHSIVLSRFFREYPDYFGVVDSFFRLERIGDPGRQKLIEYLTSKPDFILESLHRTIPEEMQTQFGLERWDWTKNFIENDGSLVIAEAKLKDEYEELKSFIEIKKQAWNKAANQSERNKLNYVIGWAEDRLKTIRNRQLINYLASSNVIPKYGFPVDVVELSINSHIPEAKKVQLERDLRIAISEFAPSSQVVAKGLIWESAGLRLLKNKAWPLYWYSECPNCGKFNLQNATIEEKLTEITCTDCQQSISRGEIHKFIVPQFGFVTNRETEPKRPEESRPKREFSTRPYFFDYKKDPVENKFPIGNIGMVTNYSSSGELAVICKGKKGIGFYVCFDCGSSFKERKSGEHKRPNGEKCSGTIRGPLHLGHTFTTDVLSILFEKYVKLETPTDVSFWLSLLYAILEGTSQSLGIRRQDLDGCLYPYKNKTALVLFDNVPGGAGHVKRITAENNLAEILIATYNRLKNCQCGLETSCYSCLRNYQNQFCHDKLKRGLVMEFLEKNLF